MGLYAILMIAMLIGIGVWAHMTFRNYDRRFDK